MNNESLAPTADGTESERTTLLIAYILHGLAVFNGITAIAGVIVNHLKAGETGSSFVGSHHRWLIRTFWWGLLWAFVCALLTMVFIGALGFLVLAVWWIFRIVRGVLNYTERKPMPV